MQILKKVLETKKEGLLNIYCTAGYPGLNDLPTIVNALHDAGVDMVEIGIPYSDPIADGETIQQSNFWRIAQDIFKNGNINGSILSGS